MKFLHQKYIQRMQCTKYESVQKYNTRKRILNINILVDESKASTSPSISFLWQVLHVTVLPILKQSIVLTFSLPFKLFAILIFDARKLLKKKLQRQTKLYRIFQLLDKNILIAWVYSLHDNSSSKVSHEMHEDEVYIEVRKDNWGSTLVLAKIVLGTHGITDHGKIEMTSDFPALASNKVGKLKFSFII